MADEVRLDVVSVAHNKGLTDAARDMKGLRSEADKLTGTLGDLEDGSFSLDRAITETQAEVVKLREEFARTGDTTLFGDLRRQQSTLTNLQKIKEALEEVSEAAAEVGGAAVAGGAGGGAGGLFGDMAGAGRVGAGPLIVGVIAGLTPHLPTLGAVIAGAVAGTIGTGGVAGGIAMASSDPRVRMAAGRVGHAIAEEFFRGGEAFVEPTIRSLRELQMAFSDMDLPEAFAKMAPHVETIAKGFGDFGRNIMPGLNAAFDRMGPFAEVAAQGLSEMGTALGGFMDNVTASEGTLQGLDTMFRFLNGSIALLGGGLEVLSDIYGAFVTNVEASFLGIAEVGRLAGVQGPGTGGRGLMALGLSWAGIMDDLGSGGEFAGAGFRAIHTGAKFAAGGVQSFGEAAELALLATGNLSAGLSETHTNFLAFASSEVAAEEAIDRFTESVKENGRTLDVDTEKGRENVEGLIRIGETARQAALDKFEETHSVKDATDVYETYRTKLYDAATALGFNKTKAQELVEKYLALAALPDITKTIKVQYRVTGKNQLVNSFGAGFIEGFADGGRVPGPVGAPRLAVVHGGEYVVSNQMQSGTQPMAGMASASPGQPIQIYGGGFMQQWFDWFEGELRHRGLRLVAA